MKRPFIQELPTVSVLAGMKPCLWSRNISGNSSPTHCRFRYGSRCILKRQDEILAKINELKSPVTVISPNISGLFIYGYHIKLQYIVPIIAVIIIWAVAASASSMKFKEESFAHYSMYRAVKEQYQHLVEITYVKSKSDAE